MCLMECWDCMGRGMSGAPTTPSMSCSSDPRPRGDGGARWSPCERIHDSMLVHPVLLLRVLPDINISSGIGTSRTVSSPSSRSKFGHSFLILIVASFSSPSDGSFDLWRLMIARACVCSLRALIVVARHDSTCKWNVSWTWLDALFRAFLGVCIYSDCALWTDILGQKHDGWE